MADGDGEEDEPVGGGVDPGLGGEARGAEVGAVDADVVEERRGGGEKGGLDGVASPGPGSGGGGGGAAEGCEVGGEFEEDPGRSGGGERRRVQRGRPD